MGDLGTSSGAPLIRLARLAPKARLFGKAEYLLPTGSTFDRVAGAILDEDSLALRGPRGGPPRMAVVGGSGSQCLAFAAAAAVRGIPLMVACPADTLAEHRILLARYPCTLLASDPARGLLGARDLAVSEAESRGAVLVFAPDNVAQATRLFAESLGAELANEVIRLAEPRPKAIVSPVGTGAVLNGIARAFHERGLSIELFGSIAARLPTLQDGVVVRASAPSLPVVELIEVSDEDAYVARREVARLEGVLVGLASAGALRVAQQLIGSGRIDQAITLLIDAGDRYFSRDAVLRGSGR